MKNRCIVFLLAVIFSFLFAFHTEAAETFAYYSYADSAVEKQAWFAGANVSEEKQSGDFLYCLNQIGEAIITGYTGAEKTVTVPATIDGHTVTSILFAFANNQTIREVIITDGITSIGSYTFFNCEHLKKVVLPESTSVFDAFSFANSGIKNIRFKASTSLLRTDSFANCKQLYCIVADGKLKIETKAFRSSSLTYMLSETEPDVAFASFGKARVEWIDNDAQWVAIMFRNPVLRVVIRNAWLWILFVILSVCAFVVLIDRLIRINALKYKKYSSDFFSAVRPTDNIDSSFMIYPEEYPMSAIMKRIVLILLPVVGFVLFLYLGLTFDFGIDNYYIRMLIMTLIVVIVFILIGIVGYKICSSDKFMLRKRKRSLHICNYAKRGNKNGK